MKCLIYVTKSKPWLFFDKSINYYSLSNKKVDNDLNGKIVAEFDGEVEEMKFKMKHTAEKSWTVYLTPSLSLYELKERSCLNNAMLDEYKPKYAIHIKNLNVFDKPKKISDFYKSTNEITFEPPLPLIKAPQNMCYAFDCLGNKYVVISVRPEWACKILNGLKDVELRRKVLKEMRE